MKNLTSLSDRSLLKVWAVYHFALVVLFSAFFFTRGMRVRIDSDLFNMMPKPVMADALSAADEKLTQMTGKSLFILVSNKDFKAARKAAENLYGMMRNSSKFEDVSLYQDMDSMKDLMDFVFKNRLNLLGDEDVSLLLSDGGAESFSQAALSKVYGAFTMTDLSSLHEDPFMLGEAALENYLSYLQASGTSMSLKDGVLAARARPLGVRGVDEELWYVMIRASLSREGAALASRESGVEFLNVAAEKIETDGTRLVFSGTPFHSHKASLNASREISVISSLSILAVVLVLLFVFRTPSPIFYSVASVLVSVASAFMATVVVFGKMHVLTLVFGTSLIGSCIDYSLHYFINWKGNAALNSGIEVRNRLFKGLSLSFVSTILCYLVLVASPFSLMRQMAVFSIAGLSSTFLTAVCVYPLVKMPSGKREIPAAKKLRLPSNLNGKVFGRIGISVMFLFCLVSLVLSAVREKNWGEGKPLSSFLRIENRIGRLYKMEGREFQNEMEASQILKYSPSAWFIVSGSSVQEVLENEENLTAALEKINQGREGSGCACTSGFIPSFRRQEASRRAAERLVEHSYSQFLNLGYSAPESLLLSEEFKKSFDASSASFVEIGKNIPDSISAAVASTWIGEIQGKFYSVVIPVSVTDYEAYRSLSDGENVFMISKVNEINRDLDRLSSTVLVFFAAVYVLIFVVLKFFYTWRQCLKIASVPLLIVLCISAVFAALGIKLEFFSITGMILVFGLGLDYIIYMVEDEKRGPSRADEDSLEPFAVALSFLTTAISFGALALSSFVPVQMMGLSIFVGLVSAFLATLFYSRR